MSSAAEPSGVIRVWDPLVRGFHWALALSMAVAWITAQDSEVAHEFAGYAALGLIGVRALWGVTGPRYARFSQFVRAPAGIADYLRSLLARSERRYIGHNPAGGAMIIALMLGVFGVSTSGWLLTTDAFWGVAWAQRLHSWLAHGVVALIVLHVAGVAIASWRHRENLPLAMVTGRKRAPQPGDVV